MGVAGGLDFWVPGSKGPKVLGLKEAEAGIPGARQSCSTEGRELGFCFAESWERKGGPANTEQWISRAQAPEGKEAGGPDSWVWNGVMAGAGTCMPVSLFGERKLGDRSAESLRGEEGQLWLLWGNCGNLNKAMKRESPLLCPRA